MTPHLIRRETADGCTFESDGTHEGDRQLEVVRDLLAAEPGSEAERAAAARLQALGLDFQPAEA